MSGILVNFIAAYNMLQQVFPTTLQAINSSDAHVSAHGTTNSTAHGSGHKAGHGSAYASVYEISNATAHQL